MNNPVSLQHLRYVKGICAGGIAVEEDLNNAVPWIQTGRPFHTVCRGPDHGCITVFTVLTNRYDPNDANKMTDKRQRKT